MADINIQTFEVDAGGDDAVELSGLYLGVHEAVAEAGQVYGFGLGTGDGAVALHAGEVAPGGGGEHVAGEVFAGDAAENGFALVLR